MNGGSSMAVWCLSLTQHPGGQLCLLQVSLILTINRSINNVINAQKNPAPHTKSHKFPLLGLLPALTTWFLVPLYLWLQPVILKEHLIPFILYVGLINAYSVGKVIIAHLTKNPNFPMTNSLLIPLWFAVIDSFGPVLGLWPSVLGSGTYQIAFMFACLGLGVGVHGSFIVSNHVRNQESFMLMDNSTIV